MKKTLKKITAMLLTALFIVNLLPISAFAYSNMSKSAEEALAYISSKGFIIEELLYVEENDEKIIFALDYLESGEISYINYMKDSFGNIYVDIIEGTKTNHLKFMADGTVYVDNVQTSFEPIDVNLNKVPGNSSYSSRAVNSFATYFTGDTPVGSDGVFEERYGKVNPLTLVLPILIKDCTVNYLTGQMVSLLKLTGLKREIFEEVAGDIIDAGFPETRIDYAAWVDRDNCNAPLEYYYKYTAYWTVTGRSFPDDYYKVEQLI